MFLKVYHKMPHTVYFEAIYADTRIEFCSPPPHNIFFYFISMNTGF